jgi:hypothetical protein
MAGIVEQPEVDPDLVGPGVQSHGVGAASAHPARGMDDELGPLVIALRQQREGPARDGPEDVRISSRIRSWGLEPPRKVTVPASCASALSSQRAAAPCGSGWRASSCRTASVKPPASAIRRPAPR